MISLKHTQQLHYAFYGCFDWHSSAHRQSVLKKPLKLFPDLPEREEIRNISNIYLTDEKIHRKILCFDGESNKSFEGIYGWTWLLKLTQELFDWDYPVSKNWPANDYFISGYPYLSSRKYEGEHWLSSFDILSIFLQH